MIFVIIAVGIFGADWLIKKYIEETKKFGTEEEILKGNIIITKYHNKGAMLNFMDKNPNGVMIVSGAILGAVLVAFGILLPKKGNYILKFGMALLVGGAGSNVMDRITKGYVVDYFSFKWLKKIIFNISDICIFIGSLFITIVSLFKK